MKCDGGCGQIAPFRVVEPESPVELWFCWDHLTEFRNGEEVRGGDGS